MDTFLQQAHPDWHGVLSYALSTIDKNYLDELSQSNEWLPGPKRLLVAFQQPLSKTRYILLGESPYPRTQSANGYAFWDNAVGSLWSDKGLSKEVNRATSLRNFIKMLLHAQGALNDDFSQSAIARLDKSNYIDSASELFLSLIDKGFLLLNATLVFSQGKVNYHAKHWRLFMHALIEQLAQLEPRPQMVLFGKIASKIALPEQFKKLVAEHPYNISFITNPEVLNFFRPMNLMVRK